ncbi:ESCRT-II complex vps25 subunit [Sistotremastrum niveocremeum HHB9708]|uniref:ESCRT-II complex vps25 subunit n=2 Tax=Sistotremastraceae TaxID=3402574 RepID=A0A164VPB1_9AGAM|nr:ESCRT-II complex vps25 subunit [Sistotremastrum niveocremeum HHB9708]KZT37916.1 ESCRT-II complex, vps25 subunit [Sistotremastrum suecicum HHB10207 ss-3]
MSKSLQKQTTASGFILPSIHALPPFFTLQLHPPSQASQTAHWTRLILSYARHRRLFTLRLEDAEVPGGEWDEIFHNSRINRRLKPTHLAFLLSTMVEQGQAIWDPPKQNRVVLLHWRLPEEWAEVLHEWATSTGQLNTILTFYEITDPPIDSAMSGIPTSLLRRAISILSKTGRAQIIEGAEGGGVRFFAPSGKP